jgi:hypothetical protein
MMDSRTISGIVAILLGVFSLMNAFTARTFDTTGVEGVITPMNERYVPATTKNRLLSALISLCVIGLGVYWILT